MNNYATDRNGWVKWTNPKIKKVKLRKWIDDQARSLATGTTVTVNEARRLLIQYYEKDGLEGVTRCYNLKMHIKGLNPEIPIIDHE